MGEGGGGRLVHSQHVNFTVRVRGESTVCLHVAWHGTPRERSYEKKHEIQQPKPEYMDRRCVPSGMHVCLHDQTEQKTIWHSKPVTVETLSVGWPAALSPFRCPAM